MAASDKIIEIRHLSKTLVIRRCWMTLLLIYVKENLLHFLGPSGCGKTTTLRLIAGFRPDEGEILFEGKDISGVPPYKRPFNTVFQRYALFPHLDVYDNIAFGLNPEGSP